MLNIKNLKSLFIEEEEATAADASASNSSEKNSSSRDAAPVANSGASDQRIMSALLKALEENNMDGFDFLEFKNSLKALSQMPLDEATKFRSAFATASTMGVTVAKLLDSVDYYKKVLMAEKDKFNKTLQDQMNDNVTAKEKQADTLTDTIKKKSDTIAQLTREINAHQADLLKTKSSIAEAKVKIDTTKDNFQSTYNSLIKQINDDAAAIKNYLG